MSPTAERRGAAAKELETHGVAKGRKMLNADTPVIDVARYLCSVQRTAAATRTGEVSS